MEWQNLDSYLIGTIQFDIFSELQSPEETWHVFILERYVQFSVIFCNAVLMVWLGYPGDPTWYYEQSLLLCWAFLVF